MICGHKLWRQSCHLIGNIPRYSSRCFSSIDILKGTLQFHVNSPEQQHICMPNHIFYKTEVNNRDVFVPPKPKELDKAALTGISFEALNGTNLSLNMGSGLARLRVNGAMPWNMGNLTIMIVKALNYASSQTTCAKKQYVGAFSVMQATDKGSTDSIPISAMLRNNRRTWYYLTRYTTSKSCLVMHA